VVLSGTAAHAPAVTAPVDDYVTGSVAAFRYLYSTYVLAAGLCAASGLEANRPWRAGVWKHP
jgi:hypothetical protein